MLIQRSGEAPGATYCGGGPVVPRAGARHPRRRLVLGGDVDETLIDDFRKKFEILLMRYDVDKDRKLSKGELAELIADATNYEQVRKRMRAKQA